MKRKLALGALAVLATGCNLTNVGNTTTIVHQDPMMGFWLVIMILAMGAIVIGLGWALGSGSRAEAQKARDAQKSLAAEAREAREWEWKVARAREQATLQAAHNEMLHREKMAEIAWNRQLQQAYQQNLEDWEKTRRTTFLKRAEKYKQLPPPQEDVDESSD